MKKFSQYLLVVIFASALLVGCSGDPADENSKGTAAKNDTGVNKAENPPLKPSSD